MQPDPGLLVTGVRLSPPEGRISVVHAQQQLKVIVHHGQTGVILSHKNIDTGLLRRHHLRPCLFHVCAACRQG